MKPSMKIFDMDFLISNVFHRGSETAATSLNTLANSSFGLRNGRFLNRFLLKAHRMWDSICFWFGSD